MNPHPYLRAFLAGVFIPTLALPFLLLAFIVTRLMLQVPFPIERGLIFPMALIPSLWALWNMLWIGSHNRSHLPLGIHGLLLPLLLLPGGAVVATLLGILSLQTTGVIWFHSIFVPYALIGPVFLGVLAAYYLIWKYIVGFLNRTLGIS
jgi:hypothetical protein